jgi:hypothetical protein
MEGTQENPSLQTKKNKVLENDKEKIKQNLELLHSQRKKQRLHNWSFFYVNDNAKMILDAPQIMHCMFYYSNPLFSFNSRMKLRKGLVSYYKISGITCFFKHVDVDHLKNLNKKSILW